MGNDDDWETKIVALTSLLPRPKPLMTGPHILIGKGCSGPESGPATGSRGPSGRIARYRVLKQIRQYLVFKE